MVDGLMATDDWRPLIRQKGACATNRLRNATKKLYPLLCHFLSAKVVNVERWISTTIISDRPLQCWTQIEMWNSFIFLIVSYDWSSKTYLGYVSVHSENQLSQNAYDYWIVFNGTGISSQIMEASFKSRKRRSYLLGSCEYYHLPST